MSKKSKKSTEQGTYALCITAGFIVGIGLGPLLNSVLITSLIGTLLGAAAGYYFNHQKKRRKH